MSGLVFAFWASLAAAGMVLFNKFKPSTYRSLLPDRETARQIACRFIERYVGICVSDWKDYAMYWFDQDTVNKLHHLGLLNRVRHVLYEWGLVEAWRIRFVDRNWSIVAGIGSSGEITFLQVDVPIRDMPSDRGAVRSPEQLQRELAASENGLWAKVKAIGRGKKEEDLQNIETYWYMAESSDLRMKVTVEVRDGYIVRIGTEQEIRTDRMEEAVKQEQLEAAFHMTGVLGSFLAVVAALLVVMKLEVRADIASGLILGSIPLICSLLTVREDIQLAMVNAYDSRMTVRMMYTLGAFSSILAGMAVGFVVFICSYAGKSLGVNMNLLFLEHAGDQVVSGIGAGIACLGFFSTAFSILEKKKWLRISPELSNRTLYLSGFTFKQGFSMSLHSSISEETVYRLLAIPAIWWMSGNMAIAVFLSSLLWAIMHQSTGYHPRWIRRIQLGVFGCVLGFFFVQYGFLSVVVIHFVHNLVLVCMPIWKYHGLSGGRFGWRFSKYPT